MIAAERYNNPGDVSLPIAGYSGPGEIVGIAGQPGYGKFPTMNDGFQAFLKRLADYIVYGLPPRHGPMKNIRAIGAFYATDPHWGADVASIARIPLGAALDISDASQMADLAAAIIRQETGKTLPELGIKEPFT